MTRESSSERRVSRRSRRSRTSWRPSPRLYSAAAGIVVATILVVLSGVLLPAPNIAKAAHVVASDCKEYTAAHPPDFDYQNNTGVFDPEYRRVCVMDSARLKELKDALIFAATGQQPNGGMFTMTPETMRSIASQSIGRSPGIRRGMGEAGAGQSLSKILGSFRVLLPDGTIGPSLETNVNGGLLPGGPSSTIMESDGSVRATSVVTSAELFKDSSGNMRSRITFKYKVVTFGPTVGEAGGACKTSSGYSNWASFLMRTDTTQPVLGGAGLTSGAICRFYTFDRKGTSIVQGDFPNFKYFGPELSVSTPSGLITPQSYSVDGLTAPAEVAAPSSGAVVLPPHETRILSDSITSNPEYTPPKPAAPPPPGVDEEQWKQHQRRKEELTPPHGAPQGNPDVTVNDDGSLTTRFADGTTLTTWPDLTELVRLRNGEEQWKYSDGVARKVNPNTGEETITYPDGTTLVQNPGQADQWTRPDVSGNPQPIPAPDPGAYPPPPAGNYTPPPSSGVGSGCEDARGPRFIIPQLDLGEKFPFSLILAAKDGLTDLVAPERAPQLDLPLVGIIDLGQWSGPVAIMRNFLWFLIGVILMPIFFFTLIKGRE